MVILLSMYRINNKNVLAKACNKKRYKCVGQSNSKVEGAKKNYPSLLVGGVWKSREERCSYMKKRETKGIYSVGPSRFKKIRHTLNT